MEHFAELLGAVVIALGSVKGIEWVKLWINGRRHNEHHSDRRRNSTLSERDREYIRQAIELTAKDMSREISSAVREEGSKTRKVLHAMERSTMAEIRKNA
jgi:hypothetical protein